MPQGACWWLVDRAGTHLSGLWEFPGGKLMPGESRENGLARELDEELGVRVLAAQPLIRVRHRYPEREVVLDVWRVDSYVGEPYGREGQPIMWRDVQGLEAAEFPPADAPVLSALRLPARYLVTPEPGGDWSVVPRSNRRPGCARIRSDPVAREIYR